MMQNEEIEKLLRLSYPIASQEIITTLAREIEKLVWLYAPTASQAHRVEIAKEYIKLMVKSIKQLDFFSEKKV